MLLLQCRNIKKDFGIHHVLKSATFDLEEGERVGLVGKNGAGKTTLVNIIAGTIQPDAGELIWHRKDVRIGYLRQSVYYTADILNELNKDDFCTSAVNLVFPRFINGRLSVLNS
jgi:macrolide transport system ATP-binding/permease protein